MSVSEIFVRRPVMTTLVMIGILVFGIAAYRLLPVSDLPNVDFPTIQVSANLPGAAPETLDRLSGPNTPHAMKPMPMLMAGQNTPPFNPLSGVSCI